MQVMNVMTGPRIRTQEYRTQEKDKYVALLLENVPKNPEKKLGELKTGFERPPDEPKFLPAEPTAGQGEAESRI